MAAEREILRAARRFAEIGFMPELSGEAADLIERNPEGFKRSVFEENLVRHAKSVIDPWDLGLVDEGELEIRMMMTEPEKHRAAVG